MEDVNEYTELVDSDDRLGSTVDELTTLCHWDDLPEWQKDNHYIHSGYVRETQSFRRCLESLLYLHNETVNIYSHLIPGLLYFSLLLYSTFYLFPIAIYDTTSFIDYFIIGFFLLGLSSCLTLSSIFHCFKAHSLKISVQGNKLDYLGIVILIVTSMVGIIHYSFADAIMAGVFFNFLTLLLGTICAIVSLKDEFRKPSLRGVRATMFVIFGLSSILPICYGLYIYGLTEAWNRSGLGHVLLELVFYISGAALYGTRVPERFAPGKFDYFGNSHQIFHVFVIIAAYCHGIALLESYEYAHTHILN